MKQYILSLYTDVDPVSNLLSVSLRHDHNMSLWVKENDKITLLRHWEFERFTGLKQHSVSFFSINDCKLFVNELLSEFSLTIDDMEYIIGDPLLSQRNENQIAFCDYPNIAVHSIAHLFSVLLSDTEVSRKENIIALAFDGAPDIVIDKNAREKYFYCGAVSKDGKYEVFPIYSPGPYWTSASRLAAMREGTLMALAYACNCETKEDLLSIYRIPFVYNNADCNETFLQIEKLYNHIMDYTMKDNNILFEKYDERFTEFENKVSVFMKLIQRYSLYTVDTLIDRICCEYNINAKNCYLAISGGYALNCPTNTYVIDKFKMKGQIAIPCVNDSGLSIGFGLAFFAKKFPKFKFKFPGAFCGKSYNMTDAIYQKYRDYILDINNNGDPSEDIIKSPIVWYEGNSESGPRALGHRSILADSRNAQHKDLLNKYKQRQWWRPVAPIIIDEYAHEWFDNAFSSPYMLNNFNVRMNKKKTVPAVLHFDGTARVQTVKKEECNSIYMVIRQFYEKTGVPIICNTSLNDRGEPIIESIEQALNFCLRKNIEVIYINKIRYQLYNHSKYQESVSCPEQRFDDYFTIYKNNPALHRELNPHSLTHTEYYLLRFNNYMKNYDIKNEKHVKIIKRWCKKINDVLITLQ